jgi:YggT family protein
MFVFGHLFIGIAKLIGMILSIFKFVLVIRILMSWINPDPYNEIVKIIYKITDPVLIPIRKYIPIQFGMVDFSPIIAFLLIYFLKYFLVNVLVRIGSGLL